MVDSVGDDDREEFEVRCTGFLAMGGGAFLDELLAVVAVERRRPVGGVGLNDEPFGPI